MDFNGNTINVSLTNLKQIVIVTKLPEYILQRVICISAKKQLNRIKDKFLINFSIM